MEAPVSRTSIRAAAASLVLLASSLPAQVSWGPVLGLNMSKFGGKDATDPSTVQSNKIGLVAGVVVDKAMEGKALFWRSGVSYSQQGTKETDPSAPGDEAVFKLAYLNIPVLAGWKLGAAGAKTVPYVMGGAQLGLKVGCDIDATSGGSTLSLGCDDPIFAGVLDIKAFDIALAVGGGIAMAAGSGTVDIAALYGMGLTSIDNGAAALDLKNQGFSFVVSYKMKLGKKM